MKSKLLLFYILAFIPLLSNSQVMDLTYREQAYFENIRQLKVREGDVYSKMEGSPYLMDEFTEGCLIHGKKDSIKVNLRYNIYHDIIEVKKDSQLYSIQKDTNKVNSFTLKNIRFKLIPVEYNKVPLTYAQIMATGHYCLYVKHIIILQPAKSAQGFQEPSPARFVKYPSDFYFCDTQNNYTKIKSFTDIIDLLPSKTKELTAYLKKNKLKFRKDEDKISFIDFINSSI